MKRSRELLIYYRQLARIIGPHKARSRTRALIQYHRTYRAPLGTRPSYAPAPSPHVARVAHYACGGSFARGAFHCAHACGAETLSECPLKRDGIKKEQR